MIMTIDRQLVQAAGNRQSFDDGTLSEEDRENRVFNHQLRMRQIIRRKQMRKKRASANIQFLGQDRYQALIKDAIA